MCCSVLRVGGAFAVCCQKPLRNGRTRLCHIILKKRKGIAQVTQGGGKKQREMFLYSIKRALECMTRNGINESYRRRIPPYATPNKEWYKRVVSLVTHHSGLQRVVSPMTHEQAVSPVTHHSTLVYTSPQMTLPHDSSAQGAF